MLKEADRLKRTCRGEISNQFLSTTGNHLKMLACENVTCLSSGGAVLSLAPPTPPSSCILVFPDCLICVILCLPFPAITHGITAAGVPQPPSLFGFVPLDQLEPWLNSRCSVRAVEITLPAWFVPSAFSMVVICYPGRPGCTRCSTRRPGHLLVFVHYFRAVR